MSEQYQRMPTQFMFIFKFYTHKTHTRTHAQCTQNNFFYMNSIAEETLGSIGSN